MRTFAFLCVLAGAWAGPTGTKNIVQLAESVSDLSTLVAAVVAGDLADTLSSPGPFTVFAPTNEAFKALPPGTFDRLMKPANKKELVDILTYHVLPEKLLSKDLITLHSVTTVEGKPLRVTDLGGRVIVGGHFVITADNVASNGVVHIIDGVLSPPSGPSGDNIAELAAANPDLSTLVTALKAADLVGTLSGKGPFTVFAPTNEAFAKLPVGVLDNLLKPQNKAQLVDLLTYHVGLGNLTFRNIYGKELIPSVEGSNLTATWHIGGCPHGPRHYCNWIDKQRLNGFVSASNGNVYPIDGVLTPPGAKTNIVQLAESVSDLSTLVAAVVAGDLADTLSSPGPFTVFAPTNEAFKALPPGTFDRLMKPENKKELVDILTYHVLPEKVLSKDLKPFQAVKTVEGKPLHVTKFGGLVRVGASLESKDLKNVTKADNVANNGVVHIIDGVLLPPSSSAILV